jgi:hypothetical protein
MIKNNIDAVARSLTGSAPGAPLSGNQLAMAEEFLTTLAARGFAVIQKSEADHLARMQRKTGGVHPTAPGRWRVSSQNGWVGLWATPGADERPGMFSPGEAREIAMALIEFAAQEERRR